MDFLNGLKTRIIIQGDNRVQRLRNRKKQTLQMAIKASDQSCNLEMEVKTINEETQEEEIYIKEFKGLMNPSKLTQDMDQKMFSIEFENQVQVGDIVKYIGDKKLGEPDSEWLMLWQHYEESCYFRAEAKRVTLEVTLPNGEILKGVKRSPVETTAPYSVEKGVQYGEMNSTVFCIFPLLSNEVLNYFKRGDKIDIQGNRYEVIARDILVTGRTFEVTLKEYFNEIVKEITEDPNNPIEEETLEPYILGNDTPSCYDIASYSIENMTGGQWETSQPKRVKIISQNEHDCKIEILYGKTFTFILYYKNKENICSKKIIVKSL